MRQLNGTLINDTQIKPEDVISVEADFVYDCIANFDASINGTVEPRCVQFSVRWNLNDQFDIDENIILPTQFEKPDKYVSVAPMQNA